MTTRPTPELIEAVYEAQDGTPHLEHGWKRGPHWVVPTLLTLADGTTVVSNRGNMTKDEALDLVDALPRTLSLQLHIEDVEYAREQGRPDA